MILIYDLGFILLNSLVPLSVILIVNFEKLRVFDISIEEEAYNNILILLRLL